MIKMWLKLSNFRHKMKVFYVDNPPCPGSFCVLQPPMLQPFPPCNADASKLHCHLYKIVHGLTNFPGAPTTCQQFHYISRSSTTEALVVPRFKTSSHQNSFSPLTICEWNKLPKEIIECKTLSSFKKILSKYYV